MVHDLVDPCVVAADPEIAGLDAQRFPDGEERIEYQLLWHHAEHAARTPVVAYDVGSHHPHFASVCARQPGDDIDEGGLAGAVRSEQAEELALLDGERNPGERAQRTEALLNRFDFEGVQLWRAAGNRASTP
jgi:hypothetical protein